MNSIFKGGDSGHTVVEVVVALSLLVAVVVPAGSLLGKLMLERTGERQVRALLLAQTALEATIGNEAYRDSTWTISPSWRIAQEVYISDRLANISVTVSYGEKALVELRTSRKIAPVQESRSYAGTEP